MHEQGLDGSEERGDDVVGGSGFGFRVFFVLRNEGGGKAGVGGVGEEQFEDLVVSVLETEGDGKRQYGSVHWADAGEGGGSGRLSPTSYVVKGGGGSILRGIENGK